MKKRDVIKLTVFFEEPFWVGVVERVREGRLEVGKIVFGSEPKDYHIRDLVLHKWEDLHFSQALETESEQPLKMNPKRMQRSVNRQLKKKGVGTKSQQALKLGHEQMKKEKKKISSFQKEERKKELFRKHALKKKEKHKGR